MALACRKKRQSSRIVKHILVSFGTSSLNLVLEKRLELSNSFYRLVKEQSLQHLLGNLTASCHPCFSILRGLSPPAQVEGRLVEFKVCKQFSSVVLV